MTPEERERAAAKFKEKNERRRRARRRTPTAGQARDYRRSLGGSFGRLPAKSFNWAAEGTSAEPRLEPIPPKPKDKK